MLEGVEEETLKKWADECKEKFNKLFIETIQKAFTGEIGTNNQMIEELKDLNWRFQAEIDDYTNDFIGDLDGGWIEQFENAEKERTSSCAQRTALTVWVSLQRFLRIKSTSSTMMEKSRTRTATVYLQTLNIVSSRSSPAASNSLD